MVYRLGTNQESDHMRIKSRKREHAGIRDHPKPDLVRLQQHGQSNDGGNNTSQEFAGTEAKSTARVTLCASRGAGRTRRGRGRGSRSGTLGKSRGSMRRNRRRSGRRARARRPNWERASVGNLL